MAPTPFHFNKHFWDRLEEVYPKEGAKGLAVEFGLSPRTISKRAYERGLKTELARRKDANANSLNFSYFKHWSVNMAYDLGYIWADGGVEINPHKLVLGCQLQDKDTILGVRERLGSKHKIAEGEIVSPVTGKVCRYIRVAIGGKPLVESLLSLGVIPAKSKLDCPWPDYDIPRELWPHFVRGYSDGDGSVSLNFGLPTRFIRAPYRSNRKTTFLLRHIFLR